MPTALLRGEVGYTPPLHTAQTMGPVSQITTHVPPAATRPPVELTAPAAPTAPKVAEATVSEAPLSAAWEQVPVKRGVMFEEHYGQNLPKPFKTIDRNVYPVATSIKSLDLDLKTYLDPKKLAYIAKA